MAGIDSFTKLMLHCDGTDESTTFTDSSLSPHTVTATSAEIDTAQSKFGGASGLFGGGSTSRLSVPDSTDWDFGSGDFTVDFWIKFNGLSGNQALVTQWGGGGSNGSFYIVKLSSNLLSFFYSPNGSSEVAINSSYTFSDSNWHHVAIVRDGNTLRFFVDGIAKGTGNLTGVTINNSSRPLNVSTYADGSGQAIDGWMDEVRISKGIARWTSDFTPPTEAYSGGQSLNINETVSLDDLWSIDTNPNLLDFSDTAILDDTWQIQTNPAILEFNENIILDDTWSIQTVEKADYISKLISINPLIFVTNTNPAKIFSVDITDPTNPITTGTELVGVQGAKDVSYNATTGFLYIACENGKVVKVDFSDLSIQSIIDLSDSDNLETVDNFDKESITLISTDASLGELHMLDEREVNLLDTDFQFLQENIDRLETALNWIESETMDTDFQFLQENIDSQMDTDFKWTEQPSAFIPIGRSDYVVKINGTNLTGDDLILDSIQIVKTIGEDDTATFNVARYHDALDQTINGASSVITSQNVVLIYIQGNLAFNGNISNINCVFESDQEHVQITAIGAQETASRQTVTMSLPSKNSKLGIYDVLIQNPVIDNPVIDPNDDSPPFFKGIKVQLGTKIKQSISWYNFFGDTEILANKVTDGNFDPKQNWTYFWFAAFKNFISGDQGGTDTLNSDLSKEFGGVEIDYDLPVPTLDISWNQFFNDEGHFDDSLVSTSQDATLKYLGTSIGSLTGDTWEITNLDYKYQRTFDDIETDLGEYTIGEAPFDEVSTENGIFIPATKFEDKSDGLYKSTDAGYNFEDYAKQVADLEYEKIQTINGGVAPKASATIVLSHDAYYFYALKLLTRINIDNTTQSGIFNNNNGFPVSIKSITLSSNSMQVSLSTDNLKSIVELEEIDERYPDPESDEFNFEATSIRNFSKYDPNSSGTIE